MFHGVSFFMLIKYYIYIVLWTTSLNNVYSSLREGDHWDQNVELNIKYSVIYYLYALLYCQLRLGYAVKKESRKTRQRNYCNQHLQPLTYTQLPFSIFRRIFYLLSILKLSLFVVSKHFLQ
jgi:hypothetical protein